MDLAISIAAYALAAVFLYRGFQTMGFLELMVAAVLTGVGKNYIRRFKEKRR